MKGDRQPGRAYKYRLENRKDKRHLRFNHGRKIVFIWFFWGLTAGCNARRFFYYYGIAQQSLKRHLLQQFFQIMFPDAESGF